LLRFSALPLQCPPLAAQVAKASLRLPEKLLMIVGILLISFQQRLHNERVDNHIRKQQQSSEMPFVMSRPDIGGAIQRGVDQYNRNKGY